MSVVNHLLFLFLPAMSEKGSTVHFRLREIGNSIDAKITQTTNPIVNMTKTIGLWLMSIYLLPYSSQTTILIPDISRSADGLTQ